MKNTPQQILKKQKKKKRLKIIKVILVVCVAIGAIVLWQSSLLGVQQFSINSSNNELNASVEKITNKYLHNNFLFLNTTSIEKDILTTHPNIKKITISNHYNGKVSIDLIEAQSIAYAKIDGQNYVVNDIGKVVSVKEKDIPKYVSQCLQFPSKKVLESFAKEYYQVRELIRNDVSDIEFLYQKFDLTFIQLHLINTNVIEITVEDMVSKLKEDVFSYEAYMKTHQNYLFNFIGKHMYTLKLE